MRYPQSSKVGHFKLQSTNREIKQIILFKIRFDALNSYT